MALTIQELIDHVLYQAQLDSSFRTKGLLWLNVARNKLASRTDYNFWRKTGSSTPFVAGQSEYDLAVDFLRADTCFKLDSQGKLGDAIWILEPYAFEPYAYGGNGVPKVAMIDENRKKIVYDSIPPSGVDQSFRLNYFIKPPAYTVSDYASYPDFNDDDLLIQQMLLIAFEGQDDERYGTKYQEVKQSDKEHQRNVSQAQNTGQIHLAQTHFKTRRRR